MSGILDDLLALGLHEDRGRDRRIGPSDARALIAGAGCRRQVAYRVHGTTRSDPADEGLALQAEMGKAIHARVAAARSLAHPDWLVEFEIQVPGLARPGRVDAYDPSTGTVDDLKTKSEDGLRAVIERGRAYPADTMQVEIYGAAIHLTLNHEVRRLSVTYVSRESGESFTDIWSYDLPAALDAWDSLVRLARSVEAATAPEDLERGGLSPTRRPCRGCPWRSRCWDIEPAEPAEDLVSLRAAPEQVANAARDLRALRAEASRIKEAADFCREVLLTHGGERFTDTDGTEREISWSAGKPPGEGGPLDTKIVRSLLAHYGERVPTLGSAPRLRFPAVDG